MSRWRILNTGYQGVRGVFGLARILNVSRRQEGKDMAGEYIPKTGDHVIARRRIRSNIYHNTVVGPVLEIWDNACRIITNKDSDIESDFQLFFSDNVFRNTSLKRSR